MSFSHHFFAIYKDNTTTTIKIIGKYHGPSPDDSSDKSLIVRT
jgi:hypothetical protein